ncbi:ankyrin-1-like [Hydractinia symbiolongicarpus]|uniref:ankyrin-1-like n=1 Tax=Hydractinia symbiolongicarpus TaxID=13093 RepID=UPI00254F5E1F|nr:ankyrin-1-like [Hydractinia symbiolongicarpus]
MANSGNTLSAFISSLKFIKKSKIDGEGDKTLLRCPSPKLLSSPSLFRHRTHSVDSAFDDSLLEDVNDVLETDSKRIKKLHGRMRRKSISRKHLSDDSLCNAVMVENVELARQVLLSDNNIDVNTFSAPGWNPLHHACRLGNIELIKLLLDAGANTSLETVEGFSPLRLAVIYGHFDAAAYLIHERGVCCHEIRDGMQECKPSLSISTTRVTMKHAKIVKTKGGGE